MSVLMYHARNCQLDTAGHFFFAAFCYCIFAIFRNIALNEKKCIVPVLYEKKYISIKLKHSIFIFYKIRFTTGGCLSLLCDKFENMSDYIVYYCCVF